MKIGNKTLSSISWECRKVDKFQNRDIKRPIEGLKYQVIQPPPLIITSKTSF